MGYQEQADFDAASGADEEERERRTDVLPGQTWRRRSDDKMIRITSIGEWAGAENVGPFAFTCSAGEVDPSDGYVHNGECCGWFVHILKADCDLVADAARDGEGRP